LPVVCQNLDQDDLYDDQEPQVMNVTPNCLAILQHFREATERRTLWIDAICINQDDIDERGAQVALMDVVYTRAAKVLVWLGKGDDATEKAMNFVRETDNWHQGFAEDFLPRFAVGDWDSNESQYFGQETLQRLEFKLKAFLDSASGMLTIHSTSVCGGGPATRSLPYPRPVCCLAV
jgi:hypothetical protein